MENTQNNAKEEFAFDPIVDPMDFGFEAVSDSFEALGQQMSDICEI